MIPRRNKLKYMCHHCGTVAFYLRRPLRDDEHITDWNAYYSDRSVDKGERLRCMRCGKQITHIIPNNVVL